MKQFKISLSKKDFHMTFPIEKFFSFYFSMLENDYFLAYFLGGWNFKNTFKSLYI